MRCLLCLCLWMLRKHEYVSVFASCTFLPLRLCSMPLIKHLASRRAQELDLGDEVRLFFGCGRGVPVIPGVQAAILWRLNVVVTMHRCRLIDASASSAPHARTKETPSVVTLGHLRSIPATDDVSTTRLTVSLLLATDCSTFFVPCTAGSMSSLCGSFSGCSRHTGCNLLQPSRHGLLASQDCTMADARGVGLACKIASSHVDEERRSSMEHIMRATDSVVKAAICQQVRLEELQLA